MADTAKRKGVELTVNMAGKVNAEGNPIVIASGSNSKVVGSPSSEGVRDVRDDRSWKAYVSQIDSPITSSLLVNGEDLNMASSLGFLYDYYEVTEESNQAPPSPPNQGSSGGTTGQGNSSSGNNHSQGGNSDSESGSPSQSEQATISFLQAVQQIKSPKHGAATVPSEHGNHHVTPKQEKMATSVKTIAIGQQIKVQPSSSSCSHAPIPIGRPSSYPPSTKSSPQVSDVSPLALSTTPPEAFNFSPYTHTQSIKSTPTVFSAQDKYAFLLEAPTSIIQRRGDDTLTYLNKGQFYTIGFEGNVDPSSSDDEIQRVKSIVHLVFRDEKDPRTECEHWQYWHSQQPNPQQRAFDIDRKSCQNIEENIDEIAYNAAGFTWSPHLNAKIVIRINCLSTDFSSQKGVKGIPLHLQIDTYEDLTNPDAEPVHRTFCQIKVFRDKGAERKNKDESKSAEKRIQKWVKQNTSACADPNMVSPTTLFHPPSKYTQLQTTTPLGPKPVLFTPAVHSAHSGTFEESSLQTLSLLASIKDRENKRTLQSHLAMAKDELADLEVVPRLKVQKIHRPNRPAVTIYVKKEEEKVYNALMLDSLTVGDMVEAVASKYGMPPEMIKNVYKKTKKGILVNMDDRMVEQFVDEDDFIINLDFDNQLGHFELTLQY